MSTIKSLKASIFLHTVAADCNVSLKKDGNEWVGLCPFHDERTPSFSIYPSQDGFERFHCFGCGAEGDVIDFVEQIKGVDRKEAMRYLGADVSYDNVATRKSELQPSVYDGITQVAVEGEIRAGQRFKLWNPKRGHFGTCIPSMVFPYRNADGSVMGYVLRQEMQYGKKETPMVMFCDIPEQGLAWCRFPFPRPRPVYNLDKIASRPDAQVILVEGEKCADALGRFLPNKLVSTWAGGTYGIRHTDWSPMAGRSIVIWPDADAPGHATALEIAGILSGIGCEVKVMDVADRDVGWDVADAERDGWTAKQVYEFIVDRVRKVEDMEPKIEEPETTPEEPAVEPKSAGGFRRALMQIVDSEPENADPEDPLASIVEPSTVDDIDMSFYDQAIETVAFETITVDAAADPIENTTVDDARDIYHEENTDRYLTNREIVNMEIPASGRMIGNYAAVPIGGDPDQIRDWAFLRDVEKYYNIRDHRQAGLMGFNAEMSTVTPVVQFEENGKLKTKTVTAAEYHSRYADGLFCKGTMYRPDIRSLVFEEHGDLFVNSYRFAEVPEEDIDWRDSASWTYCRDHIYNLLDRDDADVLIKWMAHNVQFPGVKIGWVPLLIGAEGDGKNTIFNMLRAALGYLNAKEIGEDSYASGFSAFGEGSCVVFLEEICLGSDKKSVLNKLKPMITNDTIHIVKKGKDGTNVRNVTNYMGASNYMIAVAIDNGDRRWGVFRSRFNSNAEVEAFKAANPGWFSRIRDAIDNHAGAIRSWLMSIDLSDFDPKAAPAVTNAKMEMIKRAASPEVSAVRSAIETGGIGVGQDVLSVKMLNLLISEMNRSDRVNTSQIANILLDMGWVKMDGHMKFKEVDEGKQQTVYYKPGDWCAGLDPVIHRSRIRNMITVKMIDTTHKRFDTDDGADEADAGYVLEEFDRSSVN